MREGKKIFSFREIEFGTFWSFGDLFSVCVCVDMTQYLLEHSYYFCVNRPITSHVAKRSGLIDDEDSNKHSSSHGHGNREKVPESSNGHIVEIESPRGQPFREQLPKVQSVGDLMRFMRSNDYLSHPSPGDPVRTGLEHSLAQMRNQVQLIILHAGMI
eukprot:c10109_g1_i2.p1 GENE.c10109_g1_i2~~c10109_g1_i2.p1  ORF type:complete len:158 (-),score=37.77 c10109_g1_i2:302-775(-)